MMYKGWGPVPAVALKQGKTSPAPSSLQHPAGRWCLTLGEGQLRSLTPRPWGCPRCSGVLLSLWLRGQQAERLRYALCPLPRSLGCRRHSARAADGLLRAPGASLHKVEEKFTWRPTKPNCPLHI